MSDSIDHVLQEEQFVASSPEFVQQASIDAERYQQMYRESLDDPDAFWGRVAGELHWHTPWTQVLEWQEPHAQWFVGGQTNIAYNALDRNVQRGLGDRRAIVWEGEDGEIRSFTYSQLLSRRAAGRQRAGPRWASHARRPRDTSTCR